MTLRCKKASNIHESEPDQSKSHADYKEYKANRSAPPDELYPQLPRLKEALQVFNVAMFELDGYEADDIIGTLAEKAESNPQMHTLILTGDRDAFQLVTAKTHVIAPVKGVSEVATYTPAFVHEKTGLRPDQIVDYKALKGDPSDNIKGVPGIGEKGAVDLLQKYGHLENIYAHLEELSPGMRKKLEVGEQDSIFSKKLATIIKDVPLEMHLENCRLTRAPYEKARAIFETCEFKSLLKQLEGETLKDLIEPQPVEKKEEQQAMF